MPREFSRSDRLASEIQREVAELVRTRVKEADLGLITVSDAEVSKDLAVAKVYVSFLGNRVPPETCLQHLARYLPEFRRELAKHLRIRVLPELRILHDDSIERGIRMDRLLERLAGSDSPDPDS